MNIQLNDQLLPLTAGQTLLGLLQAQGADRPGVAVAVNQHIIPRSNWGKHVLQNGDVLDLFQAIAGG